MNYKVMITIIQPYDNVLYTNHDEAVEAAAMAANEHNVDEVWIEEVQNDETRKRTRNS